MNHRKKLLVAAWLFIVLIGEMLSIEIVKQADAEVVVDNTLVTANAPDLQGPDYQITPDLGRQIGASQFYSFRTFNIGATESATFSGPPAINAIISRVTGPDPSRIDGVLRSIAPGADFYFVNPKGIIWGRNARADISGSLFTGTADYIQFEGGERFYSQPVEGELLSSEPPIAFGFLGGVSSSVRFEGAGEISVDDAEARQATIETPAGGSIAIMAGEIVYEQGTFAVDGNTITSVSQVSAPQGKILLTAIQAGEVLLESGEAGEPETSQFGTLRMNEYARLESDGGEIHIRGEKLILEKSTIEADSGFIDIDTKDELLMDKGVISTNASDASSNAGQIEISSERVVLNDSQIFANADAGRGGDIHMAVGSYDKSADTIVQAVSLSGEPGSVELTFKTGLPISDEAAQEVRDQISAMASGGAETDSSAGGGEQSGGDEGGEESESEGDAAKAAAAVGKIRETKKWMVKDCSVGAGKKVSRVSVENRDAYPTAVNDWQASPPMIVEGEKNQMTTIPGDASTNLSQKQPMETILDIDKNCPCPARD